MEKATLHVLLNAFDEKFIKETEYNQLVAKGLGLPFKKVYKFMWDEKERREKLRKQTIFIVSKGRNPKIFNISKVSKPISK